MEIGKIEIGAFRSLYEVSVAPSELTVVVGPNNAGKTNLAEALDFLADVYRHGLELAVIRKGGFENIAHRRMRRTKRPVSFQIEMTSRYRDISTLNLTWSRFRRRGDNEAKQLRDVNPRIWLRHSFEMRAAGGAIRADFAVERESLVIWGRERDEDDWFVVGGFSREGKQVRLEEGELDILDHPLWRPVGRGIVRGGTPAVPLPGLEAGDKELSEGLDTTALLANLSLFNPVVSNFRRSVGNIRIYQLAPMECRRPGVPTPNAELDRHGSNLPAVVDFMQRHRAPAWDSTLEAMRRIVPSLVDIKTAFTPDRRLTLQFIEKGVGRPWNADEVSDGTIQSLALFAAVYDPRSPLVLIEEPENSVHPWIIRTFVDACRGITGKQLIVTTHSPVLISYVQPKDISLVWRRGGRTHLRPLLEVDPEAQRLWEKGDVRLFDLLDSGYLREAVPEGFS